MYPAGGETLALIGEQELVHKAQQAAGGRGGFHTGGIVYAIISIYAC